LRHFFASWANEQGFTAKRLQALLGHSSMEMTFDIYGGLLPDDEHDQRSLQPASSRWSALRPKPHDFATHAS
jgi:integrase